MITAVHHVVGLGQDDSGPAFKSEKEATAWLDKVFKWMQASEKSMQRWYGALLNTVAVGVASCAEIQQFNAEAIGLFEIQSYFLTKFHVAGAPIPENPPRPPLFASNVSVYFDQTLKREVIRANLDCLPNGYPDTSRIQILPTGWCGPGTGELRAPVVPVIVWTGVTALLIAGAVYLSAQGVSKVLGSVSGTDKKELDRQMLQIAGESDAKRAEFLWRCFSERSSRLSGPDNTEGNRRIIMDQCRGAATAAWPNRKLPFGGTVGTVVLAGVLLGGAFVAHSIFAKRKAQKPS